MYQKVKSVNVKSSSSLLFNNLSVLVVPEKNLTTYAVVHKTVVNLANCSRDAMSVNHKQIACKEPSSIHTATILQARFCELPSRSLLVVCSQKGLQMFEPDGSTMVFWYALAGASPNEGYMFTRGIAVVSSDLIAVGSSSGDVLIFKIPPSGTNITLQETLKGHSCPISTLGSEGSLLVSADNSGNLNLWETSGGEINKVLNISGGGSPCTSVALYKGMVIGGYGTGHIRIFDASKGSMVTEVCAHAKWIHAIDVISSVGMLVSTSEDTFVRVWSLQKADNGVFIQLEFSESVPDSQLTGAQFLDSTGQSFCVSGYDMSEVIHFVKKM